ncbi:protein yellow [Orussus abietinus]|uniref:protein yellow n=1 Tax=Orussus abietinus TaxID=222816 RepID=UPI0006251A52|nr:protein yellow [Orussus abietinus]XP_012284347.1 protein yellow [Orussus abietinus]
MSRIRQILALLLVCGSLAVSRSFEREKLRGVYSWKILEFDFPSERARDAAIRQERFIPGAPVPIDVDVYYNGKQKGSVFVTIPRFQKGVPVTLGYVTDKTRDGNPVIAPYPDWDWHGLRNCDGITSVYRIQVDSCGRLWVLDTGKLEERQLCRPQLLAFSLSTNRLLKRYKFPDRLFKADSLFVTPVVDVRSHEDKCRETFVYVADVTGFSLLVYDAQRDESWKIKNKLFYPYPPHGTFHIKNETFDLMDGILGLALGPVRADGDRVLHFHSLASATEARVLTSVIRNRTLFEDDPEAVPRAFEAFEEERSSQSAAQAMDRNGVLFFGLMSDLAIGCWNSRDCSYRADNIEKVVVDSDTLQFPSGLKIITEGSGRQELWVLTSSFQRYMSGSLSANETNFRIQAGYTDELVRGTRCDAVVGSIGGVGGVGGVGGIHASAPGPLVFPK